MVAVELRPLAREDFSLLSGWLREPAIDWWWHDDPAPEALEERYGPSIDGTDPTRVLIAAVLTVVWHAGASAVIVPVHAQNVASGAV